MTTTDETIQLADALEAIDEVADAIADESMTGATREMVAEGTAERIKDEIRDLTDEGLPSEPQTVECPCGTTFDVNVMNGLICPDCGSGSDDRAENEVGSDD